MTQPGFQWVKRKTTHGISNTVHVMPASYRFMGMTLCNTHISDKNLITMDSLEDGHKCSRCVIELSKWVQNTLSGGSHQMEDRGDLIQPYRVA